MESVRFCPDCGGLVEKGFLFCPYCGKEFAFKASVGEIIDPSFKKLARAVAVKTSISRLDTCRRALDTLEKELDEFLFERL
ncbi:MAG: hypothetical protein LBT33_09120 [Spirochaetia bacterium]|jgi:RNA polymerase subunit RPABC4/transcription elongation factor Spt4|nr:hypothetical protein [Spirochaetia bacterium]